MKTQDIRNMGLAMQQVQEASAVDSTGAISGRDDDPAVQAARKKMRADHAAKKAAKMAAHKMSIRKASGKSGKPDLSGASLDQLKAILKAKNSDKNKPKNEEVEVQEAGQVKSNKIDGMNDDKGEVKSIAKKHGVTAKMHSSDHHSHDYRVSYHGDHAAVKKAVAAHHGGHDTAKGEHPHLYGKKMNEAGTATHRPNNGSDPEQGLSPNAKKEKDRKSGVGVDANKAIDMSFKTFKSMSKKASHNGGRNPPGDTAIVKSTTAPAANQKTEAVQVDELSKGTMGSYVKRATSDMAVTNMAKGMAMSKNKGKMASDLRKDANKRKAGVAMAVDKMVKKEEVNLDEIAPVVGLAVRGAASGAGSAVANKIMSSKDATMKKGAADMMKKTGTPIPAKKKNPSLTDLANLVKSKSQKEDNSNMNSDDGEGMDKVQPKAVKKKFANRKDKDIDNDGDTDSSDEYLHKRRKAISMARKGKGKVGEKALMHGGKSGDKKSSETMNVGEER